MARSKGMITSTARGINDVNGPWTKSLPRQWRLWLALLADPGGVIL